MPAFADEPELGFDEDFPPDFGPERMLQSPEPSVFPPKDFDDGVWLRGFPDDTSFAQDPIFDIIDQQELNDLNEDENDIDENLNDASSRALSVPPAIHQAVKSATVTVEFPPSTLLIPRSCYEPFEPGVPEVSEREALKRLQES